MAASLKELSDRIGSVGNTKKITDAMKLVAAAKVSGIDVVGGTRALRISSAILAGPATHRPSHPR